ncbi:MAG TPA: recombinase family protein [Clostridia bacterium]|nr:recombinase family protein [Clostridia bacterium]
MKAAVYCRLSDEDRDKRDPSDESESIQNQKTMLVQFVLQQGWELYKIYSDDDYTGADRNRPDFNNLLADAELKKFQIVVCKTQSRFTREMEYVEKYLHTLFPAWGIRFISLVDHADTAVKGNKKARQINGLINEWYLEDLSENIKSVLTSRRQNGYHIGAFSLYGYKKDTEQKGRLVIDGEAAAVVREVFHLFARGYGKTNIARLLNEHGVPNPTQYKRQHGLKYKPPKTKISTLWKYSAISDMLQNEMYIGHMVQGKYASVSYKTQQNKPRPKEEWIRVENTHEPIIDTELWNTVQQLLAAKSKPFATGSIGIFAHKVKCKNCGYGMRSTGTDGRHYLQCASRHVAKDACAGAFISVRALEEAVCAELKRLTEEYLNKAEVERGVSFDVDYLHEKAALLSDMETLQKRKAESRKALTALYLDRANGTLAEEEFSCLLQAFRKDTAHYDDRISEAQARLDDVEGKIKLADAHQFLEAYFVVSCLTREMVEKLINCIYVGKKDPDTKKIPVEIHWNF